MYGLGHLARSAALEKLRMEECVAIAQNANEAQRARWLNEHRKLAGY